LPSGNITNQTQQKQEQDKERVRKVKSKKRKQALLILRKPSSSSSGVVFLFNLRKINDEKILFDFITHVMSCLFLLKR
jgi:hypothetical protein